jgi:molybdate transport system substrate-binding protein
MRKTYLGAALLAASFLMPLEPLQAAQAGQQDAIFPPWQHGKNNDAIDRGLLFTVPEVDDLSDFHGDVSNPKLALYVGGNYFFAMAPLVGEFEKEHPDFRGRIYWETIPPGLLVKQIEVGGTITSGNMTWTVKPDAYLAGLKKVDALIHQGLLVGTAVRYATNDLAIMVPKGNPGNVRGLADLGRPDLRLVMPNPAFEGVARQIQASLGKAGGAALVTMVYKTKVADGQTILTRIHHRQTPLFLMQGRAEAGVTWQSEAKFQVQAGNSIAYVSIPANENTTAIYAGAVAKGAAHPGAAKLWLSFIHAPQALSILERYGFKPYAGNASSK